MNVTDKFLQYLYASDQIEFKNWAQHHGVTKKKGADFYFDNESLVDATKEEQPTIPHVRANGTYRWYEALDALKSYFKIS